MTFAAGCLFLRTRVASTPFRTGMYVSITTTSRASFAKVSTADWLSPRAPVTSNHGGRSLAAAARIAGLSSTSKTRILGYLSYATAQKVVASCGLFWPHRFGVGKSGKVLNQDQSRMEKMLRQAGGELSIQPRSSKGTHIEARIFITSGQQPRRRYAVACCNFTQFRAGSTKTSFSRTAIRSHMLQPERVL